MITFSVYTKNITRLKDLFNLYHVLTTYETVERDISTEVLKKVVLLFYKISSFFNDIKKINGGKFKLISNERYKLSNYYRMIQIIFRLF